MQVLVCECVRALASAVQKMCVQGQHELVLIHGDVSVVPLEGDIPEQGEEEKGARGGGGAHPRPEKSGSRRWTARKQPVMG